MKKKQLEWRKLLITILGTFMVGASVNLVFEPMNMVVGGLSGLAIVVKRLTSGIITGGMPVWFTNAILNVPLFLVAMKVKGMEFVKVTLTAIIFFTIALYIIPIKPVMEKDFFLASLFGGALSGTGLGLVFYNGGTTGGSDLLGMIINYFCPHVSGARALLLVDTVIIIFGAFIFGINRTMYAIVAAYVTSKVMDSILEGFKFAKLAYIISEHYDEISECVFQKLKRGTTFIKAQGGYTKQDKRMLMCVVSKKQIIQLKNLVGEIDKNAFIIITDVREVMGEGFIQYRQ